VMARVGQGAFCASAQGVALQNKANRAANLRGVLKRMGVSYKVHLTRWHANI